jgi:hypothetical protein
MGGCGGPVVTCWSANPEVVSSKPDNAALEIFKIHVVCKVFPTQLSTGSLPGSRISVGVSVLYTEHVKEPGGLFRKS